ncbi:MAG: HAD hydrolase-like protein, partial [Candidatus Caldatribacterium sp.]|nr:HAD hydrolase-like protein [Candidatus Caldatribacterium sp.]
RSSAASDVYKRQGLETILVLTGVTKREDITRFPYRPHRVVESLDEIEL